MFNHYHNLKRAVGLLGVVLVLSSTAQQSGIFCVVSGCSPTHACDDGMHHDTCPHACRQSGTTSASTSHDGCNDELEGSCPGPSQCPATCWCHQSSKPFELPRTLSQPIELLLTDPVYCGTTIASISHFEQSSRTATLAALDSSAATAAQLCSKLCRFLI
jgi:hypothetical protein